jgi:hypothetical protein
VLTTATTHPATLVGSQLGPAITAVAEPQLPPREAQAAVDPDPEGQAGFNPFATIGTVVQEPAFVAQESQGGDWSLPVLVTLMGIILIASLLRKLVQ